MKTRYSKQGCRITTVVRKQGDVLMEEIILEAEDLIPRDVELSVEEEDTGQWLTVAG